jgi:plastocyanin
MPRPILIALSCAAVSLAGCGSKSNSGVGEVAMRDSRFAPEQITVKVGQTIHWTNKDGYPHDVTATNGAAFKSGTVSGGGSYDYTPDKAGTIDYVCTIHPGQKGTITVTG